jgi:type III pantothenate kinase
VIACVLVGNTTIRHALFAGNDPLGGQVLGSGFVPIPEPGRPLPAGWLPRGPSIEAIAVGSVNPPRLDEALADIAGGAAPVLVAGRDLPVPIPNLYRDPAQVGIDRLLNALAASRLLPGRGAVILDFGTALSVSIVSPAGEFLGGPIAGGIGAIASGLAGRTAQLPRIAPDRPPERLLAASTREAVEAGIYRQVAGAARSILEGLAAELTFPFAVVATGGDAALFSPAVGRFDRVEPDLALRGLAICYGDGSTRRHGGGTEDDGRPTEEGGRET